MGFPGKVSRYPLSPLELVYALSLNLYIAPGYTFAAYGSVTEPFLPETRSDAVAYIGEVYRWLRLPSQVSTKSVIDETLAKALSLAEPRLSILVTIVTMNRHRELEPFAPSPRERLAGASIAVKHGLRVTLFLRPIIPGVTDREAYSILKAAIENNITSVVLGTLRVTPSIISKLRVLDPTIANEVLHRLPTKPLSSRDQVTIKGSDLKKQIARIARDYGMKVYGSACSANVDAHDEYCNACNFGPCGDPSRAPPVSDSDIAELLEYLGAKRFSVEIENEVIVLRFNKMHSSIVEVARYILIAATRRRVLLKAM